MSRVRPPWARKSQRAAVGLGASSWTIAPCQTFNISLFPVGSASIQQAFSNTALWKVTSITGQPDVGYVVSGTYMGPTAIVIGDTYDPDGQNVMSIAGVYAGQLDFTCPYAKLPTLPIGTAPKSSGPVTVKAPVTAPAPVAASSGMSTPAKVATGVAVTAGVFGLGLLVRAALLK